MIKGLSNANMKANMKYFISFVLTSLSNVPVYASLQMKLQMKSLILSMGQGLEMSEINQAFLQWPDRAILANVNSAHDR